MYTPTKTETAAVGSTATADKKQTKCFGHHHGDAAGEQQAEGEMVYGNMLQAADGVVVACPGGALSPFASSPPVHPEPERRHLITARALTGSAGLSSILSIVLAGVSMTLPLKDEKYRSDMLEGICMMLNGIVIAECFFCMIAMAACFGLLFTRPHAVLIRSRLNHSLNCLRASIMLLFLFAIYSFAVSIKLATSYANPAVSIINSVSAVIRCVALMWFFVLLGNNSMVQPFDPFY